MKQACCRRRADHGARIAFVVLGLLALGVASCAKKGEDTSAKPDTEPTAAGFNITTEPAQTLPGRVVQKSMGTECQNNLRQLRMIIDSGKSERGEGLPAASLSEVSSDPRLQQCPISHQPYTYDSSTGEVRCTFEGHESF